jgi:predicted nuclease of predicted toxin-antitoxin system
MPKAISKKLPQQSWKMKQIRLYADEQFSLPVVKILRTLEYDILTVQDAGKAEQKIPDPEVLYYATSLNRAVLTMNRRDFIRLHAKTPQHQGIVICRSSTNWEKIAQAIHNNLIQFNSIEGQLITIKLPSL